MDQVSPKYVLCFNANNLYKQLAADICRVKALVLCNIPFRLKSYMCILNSDFNTRILPKAYFLREICYFHQFISSSKKSLRAIYKGVFNGLLDNFPRSYKTTKTAITNFLSYLLNSSLYIYNKRRLFRPKPFLYSILPNSSTYLMK